MAAVAAVLFLFTAQQVHPQAASPAAASPSPGSILQADENELSLAEPQGTARVAVTGSGLSAWSFVQMFLILGLVAAAIYGVSILIKKYNKNAGSNSAGLRVLASAGLGPGKAVHVVQAGKQAFLVGAADQSVSLLSELTDKEYVDQLVLDAETRPQKAKTDFSSLLTGILDPRGKKKDSAAFHSDALDLMGKQRDRLKKL